MVYWARFCNFSWQKHSLSTVWWDFGVPENSQNCYRNFERAFTRGDSSDFDDSVCVLIVMTWSLIWATFRFFARKLFSESRRPTENIFPNPAGRPQFPNPAGRPNSFFPNPAGRSFLVQNFITKMVPSTIPVVFSIDRYIDPPTINHSWLYLFFWPRLDPARTSLGSPRYF